MTREGCNPSLLSTPQGFADTRALTVCAAFGLVLSSATTSLSRCHFMPRSLTSCCRAASSMDSESPASAASEVSARSGSSARGR
eukprot:1682012-Alexandrium_andersonii.AAC.1